jgi:hypothetical protein
MYYGISNGLRYISKAYGDAIPYVSESSTKGDYEDAHTKPNSSYLWFNFEQQQLNREEVQELIMSLYCWLAYKRLPIKPPKAEYS